MIELDTIIRTALPGRRRDLWQGTFWGGTDQTIIGYGHIIHPPPRGADVTWFLVGLARQKRTHSLYINATNDDGYLSHACAGRLVQVELGPASIGSTKLANVEFDALSELLQETTTRRRQTTGRPDAPDIAPDLSGQDTHSSRHVLLGGAALKRALRMPPQPTHPPDLGLLALLGVAGPLNAQGVLPTQPGL